MQIQVRRSWEPARWQTPDVAVVIDVFRASTTLTALVSAGARSIVSTTSDAMIHELMARGAVLVSEVLPGGLDNSPTEVMARQGWSHTDVVHRSTNLTEVVFNGTRARRLLVGALVNCGAVAAALRGLNAGTVELIACGQWHHRQATPEDDAGAAMIASALSHGGNHGGDPDAGTVPEMSALKAALAGGLIPLDRHGPEYAADIVFASRLNVLPVVAELRRIDRDRLQVGRFEA